MTKWGDRRDGTLIRDIDSMHYIMPLMYPNRCDNEAFISETIDLTAIDEYLAKKNAENPAYKYNLFQVVVTAMLKTITLRPKMNRFIVDGNMYQRNDITASFTVKKIFADNGGEALARINSKPEFTLEDIHNEIYQQVSFVRTDGNVDESTASMDALQKIPLFLKKGLGIGARFLDRKGLMPASVIATDPYQCSVILANLGSIHLKAAYHHLTNWGTTSIMVIIGEIKKRRFENEDGTEDVRNSVDIGLTIDERLADGYYYSRTIALFKKLLENPELLERPLSEEVDY